MYEGMVSIFREIADPRRGNGIRYDLVEVLIISILAILCGAEHFTEMELFGRERETWLRKFLKLEHGIPSHDTFCDVYSAVEPEAITKSFAVWVETIREKISGEVVALDGKTICASRDVPRNKKAVHIVSAWAATNRLVLGQMACEEKSNEITAIPKLLELLELKGCIVTIDAMGTQTKIAETIVDKGADYILTVKENQPQLHSDIVLYFQTERNSLTETARTEEVLHGRYETRELAISRDIAFLDPEGRWKNLSGIGMLTTTQQKVGSDVAQSNTHYIIFSNPKATAEQILSAKRSHWGIENSLHWVLDVAYNEDNCRVRADNAGIVFNLMRHLSLNLLSQEKSSKGGIKSKRLRCALSEAYLEKVLGIS
jgi:predicted transposase YbfD/YdcC